MGTRRSLIRLAGPFNVTSICNPRRIYPVCGVAVGRTAGQGSRFRYGYSAVFGAASVVLKEISRGCLFSIEVANIRLSAPIPGHAVAAFHSATRSNGSGLTRSRKTRPRPQVNCSGCRPDMTRSKTQKRIFEGTASISRALLQSHHVHETPSNS